MRGSSDVIELKLIVPSVFLPCYWKWLFKMHWNVAILHPLPYRFTMAMTLQVLELLSNPYSVLEARMVPSCSPARFVVSTNALTIPILISGDVTYTIGPHYHLSKTSPSLH